MKTILLMVGAPESLSFLAHKVSRNYCVGFLANYTRIQLKILKIRVLRGYCGGSCRFSGTTSTSSTQAAQRISHCKGETE